MTFLVISHVIAIYMVVVSLLYPPMVLDPGLSVRIVNNNVDILYYVSYRGKGIGT